MEENPYRYLSEEKPYHYLLGYGYTCFRLAWNTRYLVSNALAIVTEFNARNLLEEAKSATANDITVHLKDLPVSTDERNQFQAGASDALKKFP